MRGLLVEVSDEEPECLSYMLNLHLDGLLLYLMHSSTCAVTVANSKQHTDIMYIEKYIT